MCIVCLKFKNEELTYSESLKALKEFALDDVFTKEHLDDALTFIDSEELARERKEHDDKS